MKTANSQIDFEYNPTQRFVLENAATAALAASLTNEGSIGFDSTLKVVKYYNGTSIITVAASSAAFTPGRIPYVDSSGLLADSANLTWDNTNAFFGLGPATPLAKIDVSGSISAAAWTTTAIGIRYRLSTFTDTSSSGTVATANIHSISGGTLAASSTTTYTTVYGLSLTPPAAGTNVTITNVYALGLAGSLAFNGNASQSRLGTNTATTLTLFTNTTDRVLISSGGLFGIGAATPSSLLDINGASGALSATAWTTTGILLKSRAFSFTDTSSSGTVASMYVSVLGVPTILASSVTTYTDAAGLYVEAPVASTNVTITNPYAIITNGNVRVLGSTGILSFAQNGVTRVGASNSYNVQQGGNTRYAIAITTGNHTFSNAAASSGTTAMMTFTQSANTGGSAGAFLLSAGAHTSQTASTEIIDVLFSLNRTVQRATGAVATQRAFLIQPPTYSFVASSTITDAATFAISGAPTAGTNATITNPYALWVQAGNSRFDGTEVQVKHLRGTTSAPSISGGTGAGTGPTVSIAGNDLSGYITVTTGTSPAGTNAIIATITFNIAYSAAPIVLVLPGNNAAEDLNNAEHVRVPVTGQTNGTSTTAFNLISGTAGLAATTTYIWQYHVIQ